MDDLHNPLSNNNPTDGNSADDSTGTPLPEDNDTPAAPADDQAPVVPPDLPQTDTGQDAQQQHDGGDSTKLDTPADQPPGGAAL